MAARLSHILSLSLSIAAFCCACASESSPPRGARIGLHASWPWTSPCFEAAEWIGSHASVAEFWHFIEHVAANESDPSPADLSDREIHARVSTAIAGVFPGQSSYARLSIAATSWALSAHLMSPRVHLHRTLALETLDALDRKETKSGPEQAGKPFVVLAPTPSVSTSARMKLFSHPAELRAVLLGDKCASPACVPEGKGGQSDWLAMDDGNAHVLATLPEDRIYLTPHCGMNPLPLAYLYADPLDPTFLNWHNLLKVAAGACDIMYLLRFWDSSHLVERRKPALQGYTVHIALKSTEYKVVDDLVFTPKLFSDCRYGASSCKGAVSDIPMAVDGKVDLSLLEAQNAGLVAAWYIASLAKGNSLNALSETKRFVEDIPVTMALAVQRMSDSSSAAELKAISSSAKTIADIPSLGDSIYINGRYIPIDTLTQDLTPPIACISGIGRTGQLLRALFSKVDHARVDSIPSILQAEAKTEEGKLRLDPGINGAFDDAPVWFNDLSKDKRYANWNQLDVSDAKAVASFVEIVRTAESSTTTGLVEVRSNIVSLVLALDLGSSEHIAYLALLESVIFGMIPLRLGIILIPTGRASSLCAAVFYYCLELGGIKLANKFLRTLRQVIDYFGAGMGENAISEQLVDIVYREMSQGKETFKYTSASQILDLSDSVRSRLLRSRDWATTIGVLENESTTERADQSAVRNSLDHGKFDDDGAPSARLVGILNGIVLNDIGRDVLEIAIAEQNRIADLLTSNERGISDMSNSKELSSWILSDKSFVVVRKLGPQQPQEDIGPSSNPGDDLVTSRRKSDRRDLSLAKLASHVEEISQIIYFSNDQSRDAPEEILDEAVNVTVTVWLVAKKHSASGFVAGRAILNSLIEHGFGRRCGARFAVLEPSSNLSDFILSDLSIDGTDETVFVINGAVMPAENIRTANDLEILVAQEALSLGSKASRAAGGSQNADVVLFSRLALREVDETCGVSVSAKKAGQSSSKQPSIVKIKEILEGPNMKHSPLLFRAGVTDSTANGLSTADLSVVIVVDPLGKLALAASTFVETLATAIGQDRLELTLLLSPQVNMKLSGHKVRPIFSRFVLSPAPRFETRSGVELASGALFNALPQNMLLTVGLIPPRTWFVAPFATNYDLDNIILKNLAPAVQTLHGEYALESLLVEGACIDELHRPPQGLRLQMTGQNHTEIDTIVMANLGYFQLKTPQPGRWRLQLAPGRSKEIYNIQHIETFSIFGAQAATGKATFSSDKSGQIFVLVDSLVGARDTLLRVKRKAGMDGIPLLDPGNSSPRGRIRQSVGDRVSRMVERLYRASEADRPDFGSGKGSATTQVESINIFSVASGHLYERFLKIMMLSATKHASVPVKFWLLENYLSPSFKKIVPLFAAEHGFEVEMVTYRWPAWLREQTEKQRVIWAYKILFLDVLFPLNLSRVIFVDSDQVVRGDLAELMRMDLDGAPYGYVPFCNSRKEVDGFRFWQTGFWKDTLKGAPYHISALYVVDLDTFRETSAGDTLRYLYQSLSADPNSLSNLDQDLPNYAAVASISGTVVPIFHLPQEWLWCESWCDDSSKEQAKTIDLCNNPMTKEPKLASAKRIIREWVDLDQEATTTTQGLQELLSRDSSSVTRVATNSLERESHVESADDQSDELQSRLRDEL
jgi:Glucosyltransferase 24/UDP-glucose:Glycoprotein Glucosyltransferase/Thioredoxin-like domain